MVSRASKALDHQHVGQAMCALIGLSSLIAFQNCGKPYDFDMIPYEESPASLKEIVRVKEGDSFTSKAEITLALNKAFASAMYITREPGCESGSSWVPYATETTVRLEGPDGLHAFYAKFRSDGGVESDCFQTSIILDTEPPEANLTLAPSGSIGQTDGTIRIEASDRTSGVTGIECRLDTEPFTSCPTSMTLNGLPQGTHTFEARAIDRSGLVSEIAQTSWVVDTVAPVLGLAGGPDSSPTDLTFATFTFSATDGQGDDQGTGVSGYLCQLDTSAESACASPLTVSGLSSGDHELKVTAVDGAGNRSTAKSIRWTIVP